MREFINKIGFILILVLTFVFSSCSYVLANPNAYSTTNVKLSFKVQGAIPKTQEPTGSKLLLPTAVALTVSFSPADVEAQTGSIVEGENSEFTFTGIKNNVNYTILAEAKDTSGKILFRQSVEKSFSDEKNTLSMYLLPYSDTPFDSLTNPTKLENQTIEPGQAKTWEVSQNTVVQYLLNASASVLLYAQDSEGKAINASPSERAVFYTSIASEKSYLTLYNAGTSAESYSLQFNQSNFSINYSLSNASQALVFSTPLITTTTNTELSISTSNATLLALSDWTWNVDGVRDEAQITSAFTKTFTSAGIYTINCSVKFNGINYSGSMKVIVVNANAPLFKIVYSPDGCDTTDAPIDTSFYASGQNATILGKGSLKKTYKTTYLGFAGWNTKIDGSGLSYKTGETISVTESLVLYAHWNLVVTIESQLITLSPVLVFSTTAVATTTSIPVTIATSNPGLIGLSNWAWKVNGVLEPTETSFDFTKTFTSPGVYTVNGSVLYNGISYSGDFVVTVDDDTQSLLHIVYSTEGCDLDSPLASQDATEYTIGSSSSILNPGNIKKTVNGNPVDFIAWNTKLDGSGTSYKAGTQVSINQDLLLYPQWAIVGKKGPAGGYIFYDKGSVSDGWRYLEVAPVDQSAAAAWSTSNITITTTSGLGPAYGIENTNKIIMATGNSGVYAAKLCNDLDLNGYADWYLPTDSELYTMNTMLHYNGIGNFTNEAWYWSSIWSAANTAWNRKFIKPDAGSNNSPQLQAAFSVRAIRAFKSIKPTYTITYDANGGTGSVPIDVAGYEVGDTVTVKPNSGNLTKSGFTILSWNTKADASGTSYVLGSGTLTMPAEDITLYAQWGN